MKKQDNQLLLLRNGDEQGKKAAISTSTRECTAKFSNNEEELGTEISTESKELDYIFLVTPRAVIASWKAMSLSGSLKPQFLYIRIVVKGRIRRQELNRFLLQYRTTPHTVTKVAPYELLFNRKKFNADKVNLADERSTDSEDKEYRSRTGNNDSKEKEQVQGIEAQQERPRREDNDVHQ
eukprot:gene987-10760_t